MPSSPDSTQKNETLSSVLGGWRALAPNFAILFIMMIASTYFAGALPEQVATKFDSAGVPTEYSGRLGTLVLLPAVYVASLFLLPILLRFSRRRGDELRNALVLVPMTNTAVGVLFVSIHIGILMMAIDPERYPIDFPIVIGISLFLLFLASIMGRAERNFFIGIRTPWSLASENNWKATHRFAARILAVTGVLLIMAAIFARPSLRLTIVSVFFSMIIPVFYSLWYFQNFEKPSEGPSNG